MQDPCDRAGPPASAGRPEPLILLLLSIAAAAADDPPDDALVVAASSAPDPMRATGSLTVRALGPDLPPGTDLAAVVDAVPGVTVRRLGGLGAFSAVSVRGSTFRQVEVFLDGVPLNPDGSGAVDLSELPTAAFERVDLYRGNAPARYGAAPMGGVLDLVTPRAADVPESAGAAGGSWGTARAWGVVGEAAQEGDVDALLAFDQLHTEGDFPYFDDAGTEYTLFDDRILARENAAIDRTSLLGRVRFGPASARFALLDAFTRSHEELPGPLSVETRSASLDTARNLLVLHGDVIPGAGWRLQPRVWGLVRADTLDDRAGEVGNGAEHRRHDTSNAGAQLDVTRGLGPTATAGLLVRGRRDSYAPSDLLTGDSSDARARLVGTAALSGDVRLWEERVVLAPVVQAELLDSRALGEVPFAELPSAPVNAAVRGWVVPRVGLLVRPLETVALKADVGSYVRAPDLLELFGDRGGVVGNADLLPERGWSWDVGARAAHAFGPRLCAALDVAYARTRSRDLIVYVQNSQQTQTPINIGEAYVRTTEAALELDVAGVLASTTSFTSTLSRNLRAEPAYADNRLPRVPDLELDQRTALRWGERVELAHTFSYAGATFLDAANLFATAPRSIHGVSLRVSPSPGLPSVTLDVLNLLDVRGMAVDRAPLSDTDDTRVVKPLSDFDGYPLPGRTVLLGVSWTEPSRRSPS